MRMILAVSILASALSGAVAWGAGPEPGERFKVEARDMPKPHASPSVANSAKRVPRPDGAVLRVPAGFSAGLFAAGLVHPRWLAVAPNGDVFVAESNLGRITLLRDADGDGRAELAGVFAEGFSRPHGLAFQGAYLYVADTRRVWRIPYVVGDLKARSNAEPVTADGALGDGGGHWTRNIAFAPDGSRFVVAIGSRGNIAEESLPRASIQEFKIDGSVQRTVASGLRNPVGIAFHPVTGSLFTVVNERDGMGDGLVPDFLAEVVDRGFYGWPYAYVGTNADPRFGERRPDLVGATREPDLLFVSHSAPIGLVFYNGGMFPPAYRGDAFVALQGSWNSAKPAGYFVARVPFVDGRPMGRYEAFATGFWIGGSETAEIIGQPAGLAIAKDGALLIADDAGRAVWRVDYRR